MKLICECGQELKLIRANEDLYSTPTFGKRSQMDFWYTLCKLDENNHVEVMNIHCLKCDEIYYYQPNFQQKGAVDYENSD